MPLVVVFDVLDTAKCPAEFFKLGLMTKNGRAEIMKWIPVPSEELTFRAIRIDSMPARDLLQAHDKLEKAIAELERTGCITKFRPIHQLTREAEDSKGM